MEMKKIIAIILPLLFFASKANAQLFKEQELYPNVKTIKTKHHNRCCGNGFWNIVKLDTLGRIVEKEYYFKRKLRARHNFIYNSNNDKLYEAVTFDINIPNRIDTISRYEYKYQGNRIVYQKRISSRNDSTVIRLIENQDDTVLISQSNYDVLLVLRLLLFG